MTEQLQRIPLAGSTRVTIELQRGDLAVSWRDDIDEVLVSGSELRLEREADEIFLRGEQSGSQPLGRLFNLLPNISTPGVTIDWLSPGRSIEVSDDETVMIRAGFGAGDRSASSPVRVELPIVVAMTTVELQIGDLELISPSGEVKSALKMGDLSVNGGDSQLSATVDAGDARFTGLAGLLKVAMGAGDIDIRDCQAGVNVAIGGGETSLINVRGDAIKIAAGASPVNVQDCITQAFTCKSGTGDVRVRGGELGRFEIRSGSGDVSSTAAFGPYSQSIVSGSGSISLGVPHDLPARIEAFTSSGDIDSDLPLVSVGQRGPRSRRSNRQVGSVGSGEPRAEVSVRTSSGDIQIHWLSRAISEAIPVPVSLPDVPSPPPAPQPPASSFPATEMDDREVAASDIQGDARADVLEALARGEITVDEAEILLDRIEARGSYHH